MKRKTVNIGISILFTVTIVLTIISLTVLNYRFVMKVIDKSGYIKVITDNINNELNANNLDYNLSYEEVQKYIKKYVKSRYKYEEHKYDTKKVEQIVNKHILFLGNRDYKAISYMIYLITLISIIITGNIFLKSKRYHDLVDIFIYTFIILVMTYGIIYFNLDDSHFIVEKFVDVINHIILGVGIIFLEIGMYKKRRFKKLS